MNDHQMNGMNTRIGLLILSALLLLTSCIDPFDFDVDREGRQLVVYGHIDDGEKEFYVQLSRTTELPQVFQPFDGARITLHDDLGNEGKFYSGNDEGKYYYNRNSMPISAGRSYFIRIRTADSKIYESIPQKIPVQEVSTEVLVSYDQIQVNSGSFNAVVPKNVMQVSASTTLPNSLSPIYIRYQTIQLFAFFPTDFPDFFNSIPPPCYVNRIVDPSNISIVSTQNIAGNEVPAIFLGQNEIDYAFLAKNIISVETHVISRDAYEYWNKVRTILNNSGSIFDIPAASIKGNVFNTKDPDEEVLGLFEVSKYHVSRVLTWREDFPYRVPDDPCLYDPARPFDDYPRECIRCVELDGSGYQRPDYY